jgi:hypothetical protein
VALSPVSGALFHHAVEIFFKAELCGHLINKIAGDCTKLAAEHNARIYRKFIFSVQLQLR